MDQRRLIVGHAVKICIWVYLDQNLYGSESWFFTDVVLCCILEKMYLDTSGFFV